MTCYFLLSKQKDDILYNNKTNSVISLSTNVNTYILPYNNISYYNDNGLFESDLIEWCKQFLYKDKVFLDIGSHTGTYSISLCDLCNKVYAFEPQKMSFYALCGSVALSNKNNIECINYALGSQDQIGTIELNIISKDGGGSTIKDTNQNILKKEIIHINTLDSFNIKNIGFIKMDIEGNELDALKGSVDTLMYSNYPTILFESNKENIELFIFLEGLNYKIINVNGYYNMFLAVNKNKE